MTAGFLFVATRSFLAWRYANHRFAGSHKRPGRGPGRLDRLRVAPFITPRLRYGPLRAHRESRLSRCAQRRGHVGELAQQAAGVPRVDDFLDPEWLGRAEGGTEAVQAAFDF